MGTEVVMVDEIPFPPQVTVTKPLPILGHGITDIEIHFLQIKFTAIGVYLDPEVVGHLQKWKGKTGAELAEDDDFFEALISAPVEKLVRIVVIKEIKGSQYGVQLESAVRDRLAAVDKYEDEEEAALELVVEFFQSKYFKKDSVITFSFPAGSLHQTLGHHHVVLMHFQVASIQLPNLLHQNMLLVAQAMTAGKLDTTNVKPTIYLYTSYENHGDTLVGL